MVTQPEEKPRTWMPLIIAGSIALLVIVGALTVHFVRADLSPQKRAAADACEAQYKTQFPGGPGIIGGDIYAASEWKALSETMVRLGYLSDKQAEVTGEQADALDSAAAALASAGKDELTVVWQRDDQSHATCVAKVTGESVDSVTVSELVEPANTSPSPTPTPTP